MTDDRMARAAHAAQLLDDPLLKEAFDDLEAAAVAKWQSTGFDNVQEREWAWLMLKAAQRVRGSLQGLVDDGKIAAAQAVAPLR